MKKISNLLHHNSANNVQSTTSDPMVETVRKQPIVQETVRSDTVTEVQPVIHREIERPEIHHIQQHIYERAPPARPAQTQLPPVVVETVRPHVIREVQPIVHREVSQPHFERVEQHMVERVVAPTAHTTEMLREERPTMTNAYGTTSPTMQYHPGMMHSPPSLTRATSLTRSTSFGSSPALGTGHVVPVKGTTLLGHEAGYPASGVGTGAPVPRKGERWSDVLHHSPAAAAPLYGGMGLPHTTSVGHLTPPAAVYNEQTAVPVDYGMYGNTLADQRYHGGAGVGAVEPVRGKTWEGHSIGYPASGVGTGAPVPGKGERWSDVLPLSPNAGGRANR